MTHEVKYCCLQPIIAVANLYLIVQPMQEVQNIQTTKIAGSIYTETNNKDLSEKNKTQKDLNQEQQQSQKQQGLNNSLSQNEEQKEENKRLIAELKKEYANLEQDNHKLEQDNHKLEQDKRKLEQDKRKLEQDSPPVGRLNASNSNKDFRLWDKRTDKPNSATLTLRTKTETQSVKFSDWPLRQTKMCSFPTQLANTRIASRSQLKKQTDSMVCQICVLQWRVSKFNANHKLNHILCFPSSQEPWPEHLFRFYQAKPQKNDLFISIIKLSIILHHYHSYQFMTEPFLSPKYHLKAIMQQCNGKVFVVSLIIDAIKTASTLCHRKRQKISTLKSQVS